MTYDDKRSTNNSSSVTGLAFHTTFGLRTTDGSKPPAVIGLTHCSMHCTVERAHDYIFPARRVASRRLMIRRAASFLASNPRTQGNHEVAEAGAAGETKLDGD